MCAAFGDEPGKNLEILIGQMVNLLRDGEPLRMSKRAGTVVTIDDLVEAIGVDAARYALARYSSDSNIDLDLDLWARQSNDNPVYYVQYAHARTCRILRNAADLGMSPGDRRLRPVAALAREGGRPAARPGGVPAGGGQRRRAARAAPGRALPRGHGRGLPPVLRHRECRVLPKGDEEPVTTGHRGAAGAGRGHPHRARQRPRLCSASRRPSGCDPMSPTKPAGRTRPAPSRARLAARARRPQRPGAAPVVLDRAQGRRRPARRRRSRSPTWSPSTAPRRTSSTRPTSGRGPARSATRSRRTTSSTPARRSSAPPSPAGWPRRG